MEPQLIFPHPNFSYGVASRLDERLGLGIVPKTELVSLSSPSFFYEWIQRNAYARNKKPLPDKIGSLQTFCAGFKVRLPSSGFSLQVLITRYRR
jgi:hypothetical protein